MKSIIYHAISTAEKEARSLTESQQNPKPLNELHIDVSEHKESRKDHRQE